MSAVGGVVAVVFGIFWTVLAFTITQGSPFPFVHFFFPLFGVLFVIMGIAKVIYAISNATRPDRFSELDITTGSEEPDPLNKVFGTAGSKEPAGVEDRLKEIDQLRAKGIISPTEHAAQRERILREI